jgi:hypothetical protein
MKSVYICIFLKNEFSDQLLLWYDHEPIEMQLPFVEVFYGAQYDMYYRSKKDLRRRLRLILYYRCF